MSDQSVLNRTLHDLTNFTEQQRDLARTPHPTGLSQAEQQMLDRVSRVSPNAGRGVSQSTIPAGPQVGAGLLGAAEGLKESSRHIMDFDRAVQQGGANAMNGFNRFANAMQAATDSLLRGSQQIRQGTIDTARNFNQLSQGNNGMVDPRTTFPGLLRQQNLALQTETLGRTMHDAISRARSEFSNAAPGQGGDLTRERSMGQLNDLMRNLSNEIHQQGQAIRSAANFKDEAGGLFDRGGNRLPQQAPAAHNWTWQLSRTIDNILAFAIIPAIDQYVVRPMQTGMGAAQTMPGFLPSASLMQTPFKVMSGYLSQMGSDIQSIEMERKSLLSVTGSQSASQTMMEHAIDVARKEPVEFGTALQAFRSFAVFPGTRQEVQSSPQFREQLLEVIQRLSILTPEQGEKGAMFALRELLSGQEISLKRRFNIDLGTLLEAAGKEKGSEGQKMSKGEFLALPGSEMIKTLSTAMKRITGESALMERSLTTTVQTNDIRDTLMQAFALPFNRSGAGISMMSGSQEKEYADILVQRNRRLSSGSLSDDVIRQRSDKEAAMASTSRVGAIASGLRGLNDLVGNALGQSGIGDTIVSSIKNNIITPFLDLARSDTTKDPMDKLLTGIRKVSDGMIRAADDLTNDPTITRVVDTLTDTTITASSRLIAPAATRGMVMGIASVANNMMTPEAVVGAFNNTVGGTMGSGLISPASAFTLSGLGYGGVAMAGMLARGLTGAERFDYDRRRNVFSAMDASGRSVNMSGLGGALPKLFGPQFHKEWNLPMMAGGAALSMGALSSLNQGGSAATSLAGVVQTALGGLMMYSMVPESAKAGYSSLMTPYRERLNQARMSSSARRVARYSSDGGGLSYYDQWGNQIAAGDVDSVVARQEARAAAAAARRARIAGIGQAVSTGWSGLTGGMGPRDYANAFMQSRPMQAVMNSSFVSALGGGWQGLTGGFTAAGGWSGQMTRLRDFAANSPMLSQIGGMARYGATWAGANALPLALTAGGIGMMAGQGYQRQLEINEQTRDLRQRLTTSSLSEVERQRYMAPSTTATIGNVLGHLGTSMLMGGAGLAMTGAGTIPGAIVAGGGAVLSFTGSLLQGNAEEKRRKNLEALDVIDGYEREKRKAEAVTKDSRTEGDTARLAQMMGKQIGDSNQWDRALSLERQSDLLKQGGAYSVFRQGGSGGRDKFGWGTDQAKGWLSLGTETMDLRRKMALGNLSDTDKLDVIRMFGNANFDPSDVGYNYAKEMRGDIKTLQSGGTISEEGRARLLKNYNNFGIAAAYKKSTGRDIGDITKEMTSGLGQYQEGFRSALSNPDVGKLLGAGISADDIAQLASARAPDGTTTKKYEDLRANLLKKGGAGNLDATRIDQFTESIQKMSKGLVDASGGTKSMADATKQVSAASMKAASDLKDQQYSQMIELMPKLASVSSSRFVSSGGAGDRYFGVNRDTEKLIADDTALHMSRYMSDPSGLLTRMQAVGANISEFVNERDTKIAQTGGIIGTFSEGGRFKSDWETEGEYQFRKQSLEAQAAMGRTGAREQLQMSGDINTYLKGINDPSVLIENIRKFSEAGFLVDPEFRKKALAGMMAQGLTRNMKSGVQMMDESRDQANIEFGDKLGLSGERYFMPEEYVDLDTAKVKLPGFGDEAKSIRMKGIDAPEITSEEKKTVEKLTRAYQKTKDFAALSKGLSEMERPLAESIASYVSPDGGEAKDSLVKKLLTPSGLQEFAGSDTAAAMPLDERRKLTSLYHHMGMQRMFELQDKHGVDAVYQLSGSMGYYGRMLDQKGGTVKPAYKDRLSGELRDDIDLKGQLISEGWLEGIEPGGPLYSMLPKGLLSDKSGRSRTPLEAESWRKWNAAVRYAPGELDRGFTRGTYADSWSMDGTSGFNRGMMARGLSSTIDESVQGAIGRAEVEDASMSLGRGIADKTFDAASAIEKWWTGTNSVFRPGMGDKTALRGRLGWALAEKNLAKYDAKKKDSVGAYSLQKDLFMDSLTSGGKSTAWTEAAKKWMSGSGMGAFDSALSDEDLTSLWGVDSPIKEDLGGKLLKDSNLELDPNKVPPSVMSLAAFQQMNASNGLMGLSAGMNVPMLGGMPLMGQGTTSIFASAADTPRSSWNAYGETINYDSATGRWTNTKDLSGAKLGAEPVEQPPTTTPIVNDVMYADTNTTLQTVNDTLTSFNDILSETAARLAALPA